jgi:hypothetical protein
LLTVKVPLLLEPPKKCALIFSESVRPGLAA